MTFDQLDFTTFCIGAVSEKLGISQPAVYRMLKDSNILDGYIVASYDVLHTFSPQYITDDIIDMMKYKGCLK